MFWILWNFHVHVPVIKIWVAQNHSGQQQNFWQFLHTYFWLKKCFRYFSDSFYVVAKIRKPAYHQVGGFIIGMPLFFFFNFNTIQNNAVKTWNHHSTSRDLKTIIVESSKDLYGKKLYHYVEILHCRNFLYLLKLIIQGLSETQQVLEQSSWIGKGIFQQPLSNS